MSEIRLTAFAKVNLSLEVLGRRHDGFHEIRSILQSISLADELTLNPAGDMLLRCEPAELGGESNLVMLAARALRERHTASPGATITLSKGIPVAAGLGGASSDAAAALIGLAEMWSMRLQPSDLHIIATELGSDVPFFLTAGTALVKGRGHIVYPLPDVQSLWLLLLVPPHSIAGKTSALYRRLTPEMWTDGGRTDRLAEAISTGEGLPAGLLGNVFEGFAGSVFPSLSNFRDAMLSAGCASVHLSGAGPTLFSLFEEEHQARTVASNLVARGLHPLVARTLTSAEARPTPRLGE